MSRLHGSVFFQQAYQVLLNADCSLEEYRAFSTLARLGYKVLRHQVLILGRYEKIPNKKCA